MGHSDSSPSTNIDRGVFITTSCERFVLPGPPARHENSLAEPIAFKEWEVCHAMDGPDWTTAQATRPAHSACRREIRQHGKSGRRSRHFAALVSKTIAEVEHAVGLRLLDRGAHGIEPTIYGRALLQCGVAVFDELRQGVKSLEFLADPG